MDEEILYSLRRQPDAAFGCALHERLRTQSAKSDRRRHWPMRGVAAGAATIAVMAGLFSVPAVRASAESFLQLFRVVNFVAVPVDPSRLDALDAQPDLRRLIGEHVQVVVDPGPPLPAASLEQASTMAGFDLRVPRWLPQDAKIIEIAVQGEHVVRVTIDTVRLQQMLEALSIHDLQVPGDLNGQVVTLRVPPVVMIRYEYAGRRSRFFQSGPPEVAMPPGLDLPALGEIGLRMLGLPSADARQFARVIDWRTTLVVPLPPTARSFRQLDVAGHPGIAIQYQKANEAFTSMILWSTGERVFGLVSIQGWDQVLAMANSVE